jgi:alkaline phosphatase D
MYIRELEQEGLPGNPGRGSYIVPAREQPLGMPYHAFLGEASPQTALRRAGVTTEQWANGKAPALIQAALEQSRALRPFIANKLGKVVISKNYRQVSDAEFVHLYKRFKKISVPFNSSEEKALTGHVRAFFDRDSDTILLRQQTRFGHVLYMALLKFSSPGFGNFFGLSVAAGVGLYFTNLVLEEQGLERIKMKTPEPNAQLTCGTNLVGVAGLSLVGKAFFENHVDLMNFLQTKLSIGPVAQKELGRNALCKTALLPTARFASHLVRNMVGVGITKPDSVRLWMRTDAAGVHELQIHGGSGGARNVRIEIPDGPGDRTAVVQYPGSTGQPPLDPLTRYRYRVVRTSDGEPLGEGSFETSPATDGDTPQKVVIGLWSCHQPFTVSGTISPEATRMLSVLPRILRENDVKFVLPCGDQMYADDPGIFSLFKNCYLLRKIAPDKKICDCSAEQVRQLYGRRYRMFWSMPAIRQMYANYPCYPMLDDHEIKDSWGNDPEHASAKYENVKRGALDAYFDYQASAVLPMRPALAMRRPPGSFHYSFSYGNIGVFVMDIRSQRYNLLPRGRQIYSPAQFDDLRTFLRENSGKKVLLIVSSVPVVFVAGGLADVGAKVKPSTFYDHWSHGINRPARDALLRLLHAHQQAFPKQRIAIVSGDVHIGNAYTIHWQGGNKPRLYQLTSSALTARETRLDYFKIKIGQHFVESVDCSPAGFPGSCSARVDHLQGVNKASSNNPFTGPNFGLIEVQRLGDVSNIKFKLVGYHPTEDRPMTHFESGWLG